LKSKDNELTSRNEQITTLTNEKNASETAKAKAENDLKEANAAKAKAEQDKEEAQQAVKSKDAELTKAKEQINTLTQQQGQQPAGDDKALKKLIEIYTAQIKQPTELFYQELSLDNNWINEKYGDKGVNYLDRLKNLTADSEPEECIKAFRIVALIKATEKAQETHDNYKERLAKLPANLKKVNLRTFNKIKDTWELLEGEPKAENNPLYLADIKEKNNYIAQIKNIINL